MVDDDSRLKSFPQKNFFQRAVGSLSAVKIVPPILSASVRHCSRLSAVGVILGAKGCLILHAEICSEVLAVVGRRSEWEYERRCMNGAYLGFKV